MPFFPVGSTLPSCSSALRDCWNLAVPTRDAMCSMESSLKEASFNRFRIEFAGTRVTRPMTGAEIWHLRLGGYPESRAKKDEADACAGILSEARYRTGRWGSSGGMGAIPRSSTGWGLGKGSAADAWIETGTERLFIVTLCYELLSGINVERETSPRTVELQRLIVFPPMP